jgi:hypothetical protein
MSNRTTSLARPLKFSDVLPTWELWQDDDSLPAGTCPLCRETSWHSYRDRRVAGQWAYCFACRTSGDPIQWSARIFQTNIRQTLRILRETGAQLPAASLDRKSVGRYLRDHVRYGRTLDRFWRKSLCDLPYYEPDSFTRMQAEVLRTFDRKLRVLLSVVGASSAKKVEALFHPRSLRPRLRLNRGGRRTLRQGSGAGSSRIFRDGTGTSYCSFPWRIYRDGSPACT